MTRNSSPALIQLHHDPRLSYAGMNNLPVLSSQALSFANHACVITFRSTGMIKPDLIRSQVNGCSRFLDLPSRDLVFCGIEHDSPLAPLILWDAAHRLPVGASITLLDWMEQPSYLQRDYFRHAFAIEYQDKEQLVLRKNTLLYAEQDAGLNRWSFCIPTGPGDATGLNMMVKRILELDVPEKEIILCGRPDENFLYWDKVRVIGEDIPAPPVWITRKKNLLAQAARFENLCIMHDRVFLPSNFMSAIREFGDYFPFASFHSLWFDDVLNLSPVRYSDFNCLSEEHAADMVALNKSGQASLFVPKLFAEIEKQAFKYANPLRHQRASYLTGSMYITKRQVWQHTPQDENLYWSEFEDVEHERHANLQGIPHRLIPGAFTQSLFARPLIYFAGYTSYISASGMPHMTRKIIPLPARFKKPLIKIHEAEANKRLARFSAKYCPDGVVRHASENNMLSKLFSAIYTARFPYRETDIHQFIADVERDLLFDQMGSGLKQWLVEQFMLHRKQAKVNFARFFNDLCSQIALRPHGRRFYDSILEYFPQRGWLVKLGSFFSALHLARLNGDFLYHPGGVRGYYQAILASTPFVDYAVREDHISKKETVLQSDKEKQSCSL